MLRTGFAQLRKAVVSAALLGLVVIAGNAVNAAPPPVQDPQAVVGTVTVTVNNNEIGSFPLHDGKNHLFGELGADVYLVLTPRDITLEIDLPFGNTERVRVLQGAKQFTLTSKSVPVLGVLQAQVKLY
jgi:hypothetical protein